MSIGLEDVVGRFWGAVLELLLWWALVGASVGLAAAYFLSDRLGWDQEFLSWTLAIVGFAIGVPYDYRDLQAGVSPSTIAVFGYLGFAAFLMAVEVLVVLAYLPVSA
ncbi:hypothetical protein [Steroidobacter cummioxidans]|uniref:hypothetical protein n=1 Tax=Steroidobacter cummioxidans TaxID=1803913 RepID=UPI000E323D2C|nr:hypothetical protein [Steroidobacter cummioxidans]